MVLYSKYLDFPKRLNRLAFVISVAIMYGLFCIDPDTLFNEKSFNFRLFANDFSEVGYMAWFVSALYLSVFLFIVFRAATVLIEDKLIKSIFYALMIDSIITTLNIIFFGYYNPIESIVIRNIFVVIALFYAYFILPHGHINTGIRN